MAVPVLLAVLVATGVLCCGRPVGAVRSRLAARGTASLLLGLSVRRAAPPGDPRPRAPGRANEVTATRGAPRRPRGRADPTATLGVAVTAVAAELRAGRPPGDAWWEVLGVDVGADGAPGTADVVAAVGGAPSDMPRGVVGGARARTRSARQARTELERRVAGVLSATRLATALGAPLAGVLDECARSVTADADAEAGLRAALAGPAQTTTLLTWLPVLGIALGTLLGADPVGVLLGGGAGTMAGILGLMLTLAGRGWVAHMTIAARAGGTGRRHGG